MAQLFRCQRLSPLVYSVVAILGVVEPARAFQGTLAAQPIPTLTPEEKEILSHLSIVYLDDGQGGTVKTLDISGINVRIHNGLGATNGLPGDPLSMDEKLTVTNGLGNLIVGYNEPYGVPDAVDRTGSHNLVVGLGNNFSSFGGFVAARRNTSSGPFASVSGGTRNVASGESASVSAGYFGHASGRAASVSGGLGGQALSFGASVSGGSYNVASAYAASVSGGGANSAWGPGASVSGGYQCGAGGFSYFPLSASSVSGGYQNGAFADFSSVSGGRFNSSNGYGSSISGGRGRAAGGVDDWAAGSLIEDE